jgi:hypothetical protein
MQEGTCRADPQARERSAKVAGGVSSAAMGGVWMSMSTLGKSPSGFDAQVSTSCLRRAPLAKKAQWACSYRSVRRQRKKMEIARMKTRTLMLVATFFTAAPAAYASHVIAVQPDSDQPCTFFQVDGSPGRWFAISNQDVNYENEVALLITLLSTGKSFGFTPSGVAVCGVMRAKGLAGYNP